MKFFDIFSFPVIIVLCLTLGLAPFTPEPHIVQKWNMLTAGTLSQPIDILDFLMHAIPWMLLVLKLFPTMFFG